jgi:hypothetical protein
MNSNEISSSVYSAMQAGAPFRVYKKVILGRAFVQLLNPFDGKPEGRVLMGNPSKNDEDCFVQLWSEKEHEFFKRMNKTHIRKGIVIPVDVDEYLKITNEYDGIDYSQFTDNSIDSILNSPFLSLRAHLNKADSEAYVFRILGRAEALEKSDKIISAIKSRISEIQTAEYPEQV